MVGIVKDAGIAEDIVQATFAKLVEQGQLEDPVAYKAWLFRVAYNESVTELRRRERQRETQAVDGDRLDELATGLEKFSDSGPQANALRKEKIDLVRQAIAHLSSDERQVVRLRIYENQKYREIAETLQIPLGTALSRMRSALEKLAEYLDSL